MPTLYFFHNDACKCNAYSIKSKMVLSSNVTSTNGYNAIMFENLRTKYAICQVQVWGMKVNKSGTFEVISGLPKGYMNTIVYSEIAGIYGTCSGGVITILNAKTSASIDLFTVYVTNSSWYA